MYNPGYQKSNTWFWYVTVVIKNQIPGFDIEPWLSKHQIPNYYIIAVLKFLGKKNHLPKTAGFLLALPWNSTVLCNFWNTRTQQVSILSSFKYPELVGITKIKYPPSHWFRPRTSVSKTVKEPLNEPTTHPELLVLWQFFERNHSQTLNPKP
jgi:hypothetical protein